MPSWRIWQRVLPLTDWRRRCVALCGAEHDASYGGGARPPPGSDLQCRAPGRLRAVSLSELRSPCPRSSACRSSAHTSWLTPAWPPETTLATLNADMALRGPRSSEVARSGVARVPDRGCTARSLFLALFKAPASMYSKGVPRSYSKGVPPIQRVCRLFSRRAQRAADFWV